MEIIQWLLQHGYSVLESAGIIGSLVFTGVSLRTESKARKISNLIALTEQHRNIWEQLYQRPELARVVEPTADLASKPATGAEALFVQLLILYLGTVYKSIKLDEMLRPEGLAQDVREFFALPIPAAVWRKERKFHDTDFVAFVESVH